MITLCLGIWNSEKTLPDTLASIKGQMFDKFILFDNESTDNGVALVKASFPDVQVISFKHLPARIDNLCNLRLAMFKACDTDLIFIVDSDVILPEGAIKESADWISAKIPMFGIPYNVGHNHVTMGATMLETSVAKQLKLTERNQTCDCAIIYKELLEMGMNAINHPTMKAIHKKAKADYPSKVQRFTPLQANK